MHHPIRGGRTVCDRIAALLAGALLLAACAGPATGTPSTLSPTAIPTASPTASPIPTASTGPTASARPTASPTAPSTCAQQVLAGMTPAQRVGQLFLLGLAGDALGPAERSAIADQHIGSVWFTATTKAGVAGVKAVADAVQAQATPAATARVRFFVAANQEGGQIQALQGAGFSTIPSALVQGGRPIATLTAEARQWGGQLLAAGVNLDFAPVFDVVPPGGDATNQPIGVLQREYGHDPATAGSHAAAFVAGLAGAGVATTAKHFPGLGRVKGTTDFSSGVVDTVTSATDPYLASFRAGIDAEVPFVMVALATYTRIDLHHLAAFSSTVIGTVLRGDLGFGGVVMSDDLGATAAVAAMPPGQRALDFLTAGGDLIVSKTAAATVAMVAAVTARAASDPAFAARVDDAALHVLTAKQASGLLPCPG